MFRTFLTSLKHLPSTLLVAGCAALFVAQVSNLAADEAAQSVSALIPDAGLEAAIRREVFSKRNNQEPLTAGDLASISRIEAPRPVTPGEGSPPIQNLEGLQHCHSLMLLDLGNHEIADLGPLRGLGRLQSLTLADNRIENIEPLGDLVAMQLLDLSNNRIAKLDGIVKMRNLRTLYVADNQLSSIAPLEGLSKLGSLDIAGNVIADLTPIAGSDWLTTLEFSDNQVQTLEPLTGLSALSMLIMPNNPIDSLDPLVKMCRADAESSRRFAPYLQLYVNLDSEAAKTWDAAIEELTKLGVSVNDYRRPTAAARPTP